MKKRIGLPVALAFLSLTGCTLSESSSNNENKNSGLSELESVSYSNATSDSVSSSESSGVLNGSYSESKPDPLNNGVDVKASGNQAAFFKVSDSISISLYFTNKSLYDLSNYGGNQTTYNHKYDDVYFPANFACKIGETEYFYNDVGVRMKGATSRRTFADSKGNITNTVHFKVSFKCTFDDELYDLFQFSGYKHSWDADSKETRKDRKFFGMDKIDFKYVPRNDVSLTLNRQTYNYKSYNQEFYSYELFNNNDVAAPYARWINLSLSSQKVTKTYKYEAVECIDKKFLKRAFNENKGDLYKCTQVLSPSTAKTNQWGGSFDNVGTTNSATYANFTLDNAVTSSFDENGYANGTRRVAGSIGVEDNYNNYHPLYSLKTNDDLGDGSDFSKMVNFINAIYSVRYKSAPYSMLESVLDVDQFLKFAGISYVLGNYDDMRNNGNNFYVYFRKSDGKAVFIPYDYDYSLGLARSETNYNLMATGGMYTSTTSHNKTNKNNLFYDTIITNTNLSYYNTGSVTQKSLQSTFKGYIKQAVTNGALTYSNYTSFVSSLTDSQTSQSAEQELVKKYMASKKSTIDAVA